MSKYFSNTACIQNYRILFKIWACFLFFCLPLILTVLINCSDRRVSYYIENPWPAPDDSVAAEITYVFNAFSGINVTDDSRNNVNVDFSPLNDLLVYQKEVATGNYDIVLRNMITGQEVNLTQSQSIEKSPVFSPLGDKIAFYRSSKLYIMDINGAGVTNISDTQVDADYPPVFTRDGQQLIVTTLHGSRRHVSAVGILGGGQEILTTWTGGYNHNISPDSKRVVYVAEVESQKNIYTVKMDGTDLLRITDDPGEYRDPVFSQDGSLIAFSKETGFNVYNLYLMRSDGSGLRRLTVTESVDLRPQFIPDPQWIAFQQGVADNIDIMFVSTDRRYVVNYTNMLSSRELNPVFDPVYPIMFFQSDAGGTFNIWETDLNFLLSLSK